MVVRERILDNIETTLKGIKTVDGYNENVGLVTREIYNWTNLSPRDKPAVIIQWVQDDKSNDINIEGQHILSFLRVRIRGVYYSKTDLEGKLNDFLEDIEKIMSADQTRGGYANYTSPDVINTYQSESEFNVIFDFDFVIQYVYVYGSP